MSLIFLAVLVSASLLYRKELGGRWLAGCWSIFLLGSLLAGQDIPVLPFLCHVSAALIAAVRGVTQSTQNGLLDR